METERLIIRPFEERDGYTGPIGRDFPILWKICRRRKCRRRW